MLPLARAPLPLCLHCISDADPSLLFRSCGAKYACICECSVGSPNPSDECGTPAAPLPLSMSRHAHSNLLQGPVRICEETARSCTPGALDGTLPPLLQRSLLCWIQAQPGNRLQHKCSRDLPLDASDGCVHREVWLTLCVHRWRTLHNEAHRRHTRPCATRCNCVWQARVHFAPGDLRPLGSRARPPRGVTNGLTCRHPHQRVEGRPPTRRPCMYLTPRHVARRRAVAADI